MKFDFDTFVERGGKDSLAADMVPFPVKPDEGVKKIPMWIADMSFPTAPAVIRAIRERLETPCFGYFENPEEYYAAIIRWQKERNGVEGLTREAITYENGVLGGVASAIRAFTAPGDNILVHSPTYIGFTGTVNRMGRNLVHSALVRDADGIWRMDYADMEEKIKANGIHLAIFCTPHNPTGRVWERSELEEMIELFRKYDVLVISDEIWSDIIMPGYRHIPLQSVSEAAREMTIAFYSPSKTFSLAGLVGSYGIIYNRYLRDRVVKEAASVVYNAANVLSMRALIGAYSGEGMEWADEMCQVVDRNLAWACDFIRENFPGVSCMRPQGTYMLYLDCAGWCKAHEEPVGDLQIRGVKAGVIWSNGESFVMPNTIRMNLALPFEVMKEAFERLKEKAFI